ncbi:MAG: FAD-binding oxidoreductase [Coleofasciculaceae cyanobacterium SM2_1_6]|nr:FAD-binding oxidoreductase [Coleofasciculaceae cyanobacterium SM2_1_6]
MSTIVPHLDHLQQLTNPTNIQDWQPAIAWGLRHTEPKETIPMITPDTGQEMGEVMKFAQAHNLKILPTGQGTKLHWGGLLGEVDLVVSTQKLNQVVDHAVGDMTVTIEAGIDLAELQTILGKEQQFLPLGPNLAGTVGGTIATAMTGSWRQRYGGVRDLLLGISFLRADGELAKAGGRVVKNVAGYDLMKLFTGSYGTLGVITQATFRVYPLPETSTTLLCTGDLAGITATAQTFLNSALTPTSCDLLSPKLTQELGGEKSLGLLVRFQSILPSIQEQSTRLTELATAHSLKVMTFADTSESSLWQDLTNQIFPHTQIPTLTCKIGILPTAAPQLLQSLHNLDNSSLGLIHAGSGVGWLHLDQAVISPEILQKIRHQCQDSQGYLSLLAAPTDYKKQLDVWGYHGNALEIMEKLKQQFDPQAVLSPQRFVGNL